MSKRSRKLPPSQRPWHRPQTDEGRVFHDEMSRPDRPAKEQGPRLEIFNTADEMRAASARILEELEGRPCNLCHKPENGGGVLVEPCAGIVFALQLCPSCLHRHQNGDPVVRSAIDANVRLWLARPTELTGAALFRATIRPHQ